MKIKKSLKNLFLLCFAIAFALPAVAFAAVHDLVIYHTNDVHGYTFEERDHDGQLTRIGYDRLKAIVDSDPSSRKLLLDAGDVLHGQAFATSKRGELSAIVLSLMGYDAIAAGNHDFDYGSARLLELADKYRLNFLAANITADKPDSRGGYILPPYTVRSWGDLKVGIFGLTTPETKTATDPRNVEGLSISDPIKSAREMVKKLEREGADLIIALTHVGSEPYCVPMSQTIAEKVAGIDIIIDGHSHSVLTTRVRRADDSSALVASTGAFFQNIGRITVDRKPGGGFTISGKTLPASSLEFENMSPDPAMSMAMGVLKAEYDKEMGQIVLKVPFDLDGARERVRSTSTNMGRIICASLTDATGADAALLNGGSIRDSIQAGSVTKGQLLSVLPFGNYIYTIEITGKDILAALNHGLSQPGAGAFPQFWGMEVTTRPGEAAGSDGTKASPFSVDSVMIGGKPLNPDGTYTLAINDFMHAGGDGYDMFTKYPYHEFATLEEVFRNFVEKKDESALREISDAVVMK
ncbi:MAG: bifunctional metallophosphatase/5'-nucleotidase [Synergistaceae bacterium]|jgi:2',3'-cyclic-nucleotide 2'-phosphodiesterase (5'-nucleotidase family)|nr:bifunctional metallophosphatase/5'-nucleotidase [Synergistaceae bacterium]